LDRRTATVAVVASAACFATLGILQRWAFAGNAEPMTLLAIRFALASAAMGLVQAMRDPGSLKVGRSDLVRFGVMSVTGYGAASLCYAFAVGIIGPSVTTVLLYTYPALVSILGWLFLKERFPVRRLLAVVATFAGCALAAGALSPEKGLSIAGIVLGLAAGFGYAIFNIVSFASMRSIPRMTVMSYVFGMSAVEMGVAAAVKGTWGSVAGWSPSAWGSLALMVLVPTVAAILLYLGGIKRMGAAQAAVVSTLELPFTVLFAAFAFPAERLTVIQLVGAAIVLGGVVLAEWGSPTGEVDGVAAV
jgi:drug/metabolite transporter (DMT)-like permease